MYNNKSMIIENFIKHVEKNVYFQNIYMFIERIKNMIIIKKIKFFETIYIFIFETQRLLNILKCFQKNKNV